jgi:hypothetical protein
MATTYTSDLAASNSAFTGPGGGVVFVREATYVPATALVVNDVIQMVPVAKGERVLDVQVITEILDSDGTPAIVLDVGDGGDTDRYIDGTTVGQTGGFAVLGSGIAGDAEVTALHKLYTEADTIDILVQVAPDVAVTDAVIRVRAFIVRA